MHPILARRGRLGLYLAAWLPLAALVAVLLALPGGLAPLEAAVAAPPLCLFYAFVCLSSWHLCRVLVPGGATFFRVLAAHGAAAAISSLLWILAGLQMAYFLGLIPGFAGFPDRFNRQVPVLFAAGVLLYLIGVAVHYALLAFEREREADRRAAESRVLARESELALLRGQVNPHFLFNALNSVSALVGSEPERAREMLGEVASLLRAGLGAGGKGTIRLAEELALARGYLAVEQVRFADKLVVDERVDPSAGGVPVPPLLLQPLVENAVTHGVSRLATGGTILLEARIVDGRLRVVVENPCEEGGAATAAPGRGVGLVNVRRRLEATFGGAAQLLQTSGGGRFRVELRLPATPVDPS